MEVRFPSAPVDLFARLMLSYDPSPADAETLRAGLTNRNPEVVEACRRALDSLQEK